MATAKRDATEGEEKNVHHIEGHYKRRGEGCPPHRETLQKEGRRMSTT